MSVASESITLTFPRAAIRGVLSLSSSLLDHMHELLERNTDEPLMGVEREELEKLVEMAQFGQVMAAALQAQVKP